MITKTVIICLLLAGCLLTASTGGGYALETSETVDMSYGNAGKDGLRTVAVLKDGGYMLAGWLDQDTKDHFGVGYLVNIGPDGTMRWDQKLRTNGRNRITNVFERENGEFLIVVEEFPSAEDPGQVVLMELTETGKVIRQHSLGGPGPDIVEVMRQTQDGGFVFVGESAANFSGNYQGWIAKLSSTYEIEWQHHLGGAGRDRLTDCIVLPDGSVVGVGYLDNARDGGRLEEQPWLVKADKNGEILWTKTPSFGTAGAIRGIALMPDGQLALVGYVKDTNVGKFDSWLGVASADGTLISQRVIKKPGYNLLMAVEPMPTGDYVAVGSAKTADNKYGALLVRFSETGENIHQYVIDKPGTQFGRIVRPVTGNSIVLGGFNNQSGLHGDQMWFWKSDADKLAWTIVIPPEEQDKGIERNE